METTQNLTDTPAPVPQLGRTVYYRISEGVLQTIRTRGGSQRVVVESLTVSRSQH
jgi:hypothetical protein